MTLPIPFITQMRKILGDDYEKFESSLKSESPVSIRVNPQKYSYNSLFNHFNIKACVPWCKYGYYLPFRPNFTTDPLFHAGCYYVQEASSMFIHHLLQPHMSESPLKILDLCGAPGGKSTLLLSLMHADSILFTNDINSKRSNILRENIIKWGNNNVVVTNNSSEDYKKSQIKFDIVLCDAPCSGEGMFRKTPNSIAEWSPVNVKMCSERQRDILDNIWNCIKPGGILVYSTCTYNTLEDEANAQYIIEKLYGIPLKVSIDNTWGIDTNNYLGENDTPVYHFFPHKINGEGFFACIFQKPQLSNDISFNHKKLKKNKYVSNAISCPKEFIGCLNDFESYYFTTDSHENIYAIKREHKNIISIAKQSLNIIHKGIQICSIKGEKYRPAHSLAMSNALRRGFFKEVEIDTPTALSYLKCESLNMPLNDRGFLLLIYKNQPLGFVNNIGSHANNMYPQEWRIRNTT